MKYLLLVCWDAENMNALTEPEPTDTSDEESFPWLDDLQARAAGSRATNWLRRAGPAPSASATGRRSSPTVRSPRPRRQSAGSTSSSAGASRRPSPCVQAHGTSPAAPTITKALKAVARPSTCAWMNTTALNTPAPGAPTRSPARSRCRRQGRARKSRRARLVLADP